MDGRGHCRRGDGGAQNGRNTARHEVRSEGEELFFERAKSIRGQRAKAALQGRNVADFDRLIDSSWQLNTAAGDTQSCLLATAAGFSDLCGTGTVTKPDSVDLCTKLAVGLRQELREYCLYMPLYNGVEFLEIGVSEQAMFTPIPPRSLKPLVFYGTSICQGGCASRPGMAWPSIVGRKLDRPIVNLGFSANGTMETSVGQLLAELDATAYVIDYGSYPDQKRAYFTLRDARRILSLVTPGTGLEAAIYSGLNVLTGDYLTREWQCDDGTPMRIERCLIDANWGQSTDVVYQFCRQSSHATVVMPSHGRFIGASSKPFSEYRCVPGERLGLNWRIPSLQGRRPVRHVVYDTNYWKSFLCARLLVPMGDRGCLSLFGDRPEIHRLFSEHITAEYRVKTEGRGRTVDEWKIRPGNPDNHWLDCLVGCAVGASMQGVALDGMERHQAVSKRRRMTAAEMAALARGR